MLELDLFVYQGFRKVYLDFAVKPFFSIAQLPQKYYPLQMWSKVTQN